MHKHLCVLVTLWFDAAMQKIEICLGQNCKPYGGQALADALKDKGVAFTTFECRGLCTYAPVAFVQDKAKLKAQLSDIIQE
jgi:NADH:ubiquinone oxidoreductase subunit E